MATLSPERQKYEAARRNQATIGQVETLLVAETTRLLARTAGFGQQEMGGYLRKITPGLIDRYGKVNAAAAVRYYDEQRRIWWTTRNPAFTAEARKNQQRMAERYAAARLRGEIYVAKLPEFNPVEASKPVIGYGMARFQAEGAEAMRSAVTNALTRAVGSYNRDVMLYNSGLDDAVVRVQRVAEPGACAFCALMAFSSERSASGKGLEVRTGSYAVNFHENCKCSIETLYIGDPVIRPPYYDKFESDYLSATASIQGPLKTKQVLAQMRVIGGLK